MHRKSRGFTIIELMIVCTIIAIVASIAIPSMLHARMSANEAGAIGSLRAIATAQVTLRRSAPQFATPYYQLYQDASGNVIQGIDQALASADLSTPSPVAKEGYYYCDLIAAIPIAGGAPVPLNPKMRYGISAAPADYNLTGLNSYYCDDKGVVWQCDTGEGITSPTLLIMSENPKTLGYVVAE